MLALDALQRRYDDAAVELYGAAEQLDRVQHSALAASVAVFLVLTLLAVGRTLRRLGADIAAVERSARTLVPDLPAVVGADSDALARLRATMDAAAHLVNTERARIKLMLEGAQIVLWTMDLETRQLWLEARDPVEDGVERHVALPTDYQSWQAMIHPADRDRVVARLRRAATETGEVADEYRLVQPDGSITWILTRGKVAGPGGPTMPFGSVLHGVALNVTRQKEAEEAARAATEMRERVVHDLQEVVFQADECGAWSFLNPAWTGITGFPLADSLGRPQANYLHPADRDRIAELRRRMLASELEEVRAEVRLLTSDGRWRRMEVASRVARDADGRAVGTAGIMHDVTEQREATEALQAANELLESRVGERTEQLRKLNEQLVHDAFHDGLTGLPNRALFVDRLGHAIERAQRAPDRSYGVLFLDFDRFKMVNDSFGHACGDDLLIAIGKRLQAALRPADTVARLGGDEFTILLEDLEDVQDARRVAERVGHWLLEPFSVSGQSLHMTASVGLVTASLGYTTPGDVLRDAEVAMYQAKASGRGRQVDFEPGMRERALQALTLEADLRTAIDRGGLTVHYQPLVRIGDERIVGVEALVRWPHPAYGIVSPGEFIPLAEETGLIVDLDRFVLRAAAREVAHLRKTLVAADLALSVNVSGKRFQRSDLIADVTSALDASGLPATALRVEITESVLLDTSPTSPPTSTAFAPWASRSTSTISGPGTPPWATCSGSRPTP